MQQKVEAKTPELTNTIKLTHGFLMQQDMRPRMTMSSYLDDELDDGLFGSFSSIHVISLQLKQKIVANNVVWRNKSK